MSRPLRATLKAMAPNPKGTGHTTVVEVIAVAVVVVLPNRHKGRGAGDGMIGKLRPVDPTIFQIENGRLILQHTKNGYYILGLFRSNGSFTSFIPF